MSDKVSIYENKYFLIFIYSLLIIKAFIWSINIPYNAAPDESAHFSTPLFIYNHSRLPVFGKDIDGTFDFRAGAAQITAPTYSSMPYIGYIFSAVFMKLLAPLNDRYIIFYARLTSLLFYAVFAVFAWLIGKRLFANNSMLSFLFFWVIVNIP